VSTGRGACSGPPIGSSIRDGPSVSDAPNAPGTTEADDGADLQARPADLHRGGHRGEHQLVNAIDEPYRLFTKRLVAAIA